MRTRVTTSLLGLGLTAAALVGCQTQTWISMCFTDATLRSCEVSVSGNAFQDLPFPVSGPILGGVGDRFRLETASVEGTATFSAGGTYSCGAGQTLLIGDSALLCRAVGENSLDFTISRTR